MNINVSSFLNEYIEESLENIDILLDSISQYLKNPNNHDELELILRTLHTVKGTSRMMKINKVEEVAHGLEDIYKSIQMGKITINKRIVVLTLSVLKIIKDYVGKLLNEEAPEFRRFEDIVYNIKNVVEGSDFQTDFSPKLDDFDSDLENDESSDFSGVQSIRINLSSVNEIIRSYDKLITGEFRLKNSIALLEKLIAKGENPGQLFRQIHEDISMLEQQTFSVQEEIISLRMLPLNMVLKTLKQSAEEEALKLEKEIEFDIPLSDIYLDKIILESLPGILIHLVRNSIDHGIESKEEREKLGKNAIGKISVSAKQVSNRIEITVWDDGRGIDSEKIRKKAIEMFPDRKDEIEEMDSKYLQQFLFMSGFSTASKQSLISGRGVGLDSVRNLMDKLKGRIKVNSKNSEGTSFILSLPLSLATQEGLFLYAGGMKFLVLSHYVAEIVTESESNLLQLQHGTFLPLRNDLLPVYDASLIIGSKEKRKKSGGNRSIVVVDYLEKRIGIIVDDILNYMTVVVKIMPPVFKNFNAVQGVVFDENYNIIPLLHIPDLMKRMNALKDFEVKSFDVSNGSPERYVLVADDSHTTRQIEKMILEVEGYNVTLACDGIDALEKIKQQRYDIVITDIKMPRMDGLVLIENLRRMETTKDIPVIVISSVFEDDTHEKVMNAGAQAHIVKSEFERGNLVAAVKELLN